LWKIACRAHRRLAIVTRQQRGNGRMLHANCALSENDRGHCCHGRRGKGLSGEEDLIFAAMSRATRRLSIGGLERGQTLRAQQFHGFIFAVSGSS
jgi:hypothetical protein